MTESGDRPALHTYMVQWHRMRTGSPLTFSDGERIIAVVRQEPSIIPGLDEHDLWLLVELPPGADSS